MILKPTLKRLCSLCSSLCKFVKFVSHNSFEYETFYFEFGSLPKGVFLSDVAPNPQIEYTHEYLRTKSLKSRIPKLQNYEIFILNKL